MTRPAISVVVPTRERPEQLAVLVEALGRQQIEAPFEVCIVDDASRDDTWEVLQRLAATTSLDLRPIRLDRNVGPATARNVGWRAARADVVAFTDDDCRPDERWLSRLLDAIVDVDLVQGRTVPEPDQLAGIGPFGRTLEVQEEGLYPTCNVAYRKEVLASVGGFHEGFRRSCDDTDLAWRVKETGATTRFAPDAVVFHAVHPYSYAEHLREKFRWDGVPQVIRRHPGLRSVLHSRYFWRASHPPALTAGAGLAIVGSAAFGTGRRRVAGVIVGLVLVAPYVRFRLSELPLDCGPRRRVALLPAILAADLVEVGVLAVASLRHRSLVL